jgi:hypothetical protein
MGPIESKKFEGRSQKYSGFNPLPSVSFVLRPSFFLTDLAGYVVRPSRKALNFRLLDGCRSFRSALASI